MRLRRSGLATVMLASIMLALLAVPLAAAPVAPVAQPSVSISFADGAVQPLGVSTNIVTRYGKGGQLGLPMDAVQRMGAGIILEQFRWDKIEHPCGTWDWGFYDELVLEAKKHNLKIIAQLGYNNTLCAPGQVTQAPSTPIDRLRGWVQQRQSKQPLTDQASSTGEPFNQNPPDPAAWKRFVATVVARYKDTVQTWEIWNEPDDTDFWTGTPDQYVSLLHSSYDTIKGVDPSAKVINGACSKLDLVWCNQYIALGGPNYSDVFGFHPYVGQTNFDNGAFEKTDLAHLKSIQGQINKPIWFTEFGWSSANTGSDSNGIGSESLQARYLVRQFVTMFGYPGLSLGPMLWYDFRDDGTDPGNKDAHFGLIGNDWMTPKAGYYAFQTLATKLTGATFVERRESGAGTAYRFNRNGTVVDVVWGGGRTSLPTLSPVAQAYNISGQPLPTTVSNGAIQVDIADDPVFVEHSRPVATTTPGAGATPAASPVQTPPAGGTGGNAPPPGSAPGSGSVPPPGSAPGGGAVPPAGSAPTGAMAPPAGSVPTNVIAPPVTAANAGLQSWTDSRQRVRLQFPAGWSVTRLADFANNALELDGPDNLLVFLDIYDQSGTPMQAAYAFRDVHGMSTAFAYTDGPVNTIQVGGESGAGMTFTYTARNAPATGARDGAIWIVNHAGSEFDFQARNIGTHGPEITALIASVAFAS